MAGQRLVSLIASDVEQRQTVGRWLQSSGIVAYGFSSVDEFAAAADRRSIDCLVAIGQHSCDEELSLVRQLAQELTLAPIVIVSHFTATKEVVALMRAGAYGVLPQPLEPSVLVREVRRAMDGHPETRAIRDRVAAIRDSYTSLTTEERAVLRRVAQGLPNKAIAFQLDLSARTIDRRRSSGMRKMGIDSVVTLAVQLARLELASRVPLID